MSEEREEKSFGSLETLRSGWGTGEAEASFGDLETLRGDGWQEDSLGSRETLRSESGRGEEERSFGERETLRSGEWGILEEWEGKRWKAGEEILGRYVVEGELGQGGMGVVYACLDKVGGVRVAVKALPPELSHNSVEMEEVRENFELVYKLSHPNIAGVRTLERDGKGEYFLVMEIAEGVSLRKWLRKKGRGTGYSRRAIPLEEAVGVLRQVAAALDYAHGEKVIHRDVKPGNVMIDGRGRVKVLDFGLAAQIRTSMSRASQAYRGTSGTGPYMAPEQWEGKPQDAKTDQYALAVMAYEMLAGHLPFENDNWQVLKDAVLCGNIDSIPGLPVRAMDALIRGLAKRAEDRYRSCGEFVAALEGKTQLTIKGSAIRPVGTNKGSRKKRGGWGWVAALAVAVGLGAGAWWWQGRSADAPKKTEEIQRRVAEAERRLEEEREATENTRRELEGWLAQLKQQHQQETGGRDTADESNPVPSPSLADAHQEADEIQRRVAEAERRLEEEREAIKKTRHELEGWLERLKQQHQQQQESEEQGTANEDHLAPAPSLRVGRWAGEERVIALPGGVEMTMVWCPAGSFTMGSPANEEGRNTDERQHRVTLTKGFWMAKTEVTQMQWKSVMGSNPAFHKGDDLPVETVSWDKCQEFCEKAGLDLPTEAEWEYACRAGSTGPYAGSGRPDEMGWHRENAENATHSVGKKRANAWGLHDMHGNVWEWCADGWQYDLEPKPVKDPTVVSGESRVLRGGCSWDAPRNCRSASRDGDDPGNRSRFSGFRPVLRPN